jgi:hypothetical protein
MAAKHVALVCRVRLSAVSTTIPTELRNDVCSAGIFTYPTI